MRGMASFTMGATLAVGLSLILLLTLLLLLLAHLFCSLLRQEGRGGDPQATVETLEGHRSGGASAEEDPSSSKPLSFPFYAHGVLRAPTKFLLTVPKLEAAAAPPPPPPVKEVECWASDASSCASPPLSPHHSPASIAGDAADHFVRICNPIYEGATTSGEAEGDGTPFLTPEASPSCLDADEGMGSSDGSPPLAVMKKLAPALPTASSAAAVGLMDGRRSLATSASATETNRPSSPSSSNSLCSSPSW